jgi:hypothetical protein
MAIIPKIAVVTVPGWKVVISISGELVFIDNAIAAGITVRIDICALVVIGFLVSRSGCGIDYRRRCYVNAGPAERKPEMGAYVYLCFARSGDQQACSSQSGE